LTGIILSIYAALRFVYPRWVSTRLPADAPRIAFSLDNSLIGWIGVTDVTDLSGVTVRDHATKSPGRKNEGAGPMLSCCTGPAVPRCDPFFAQDRWDANRQETRVRSATSISR